MPLLKRSKLYQEVWSRPCTKIAAELGISSSALKRICAGCSQSDKEAIFAGTARRVYRLNC